MNWIKQHLALITLFALLASAAGLFLTGRLQLISSPAKNSASAERSETGDEASGGQTNRLQGNTVVLDADSLRLSAIRVAPVTRGSVPVMFQAPGEVQLADDRMAHVTPPIPGVARAVEKGIGDFVEKESPLCSIESVELGDARASYVAAHADTEIADRNYSRWKLLFDKGLKTENELLTAEAELTRAKLKQDAANARLRAMGAGTQEIQALTNKGAEAVSNRYALRSPITGTILRRNVTVGQNVAASDQVFLIADLSEVWVQAVAHEQDLRSIRTGMRAIVRIPNMLDAGLRGTVTYIGDQVDEKTRTVALRILAQNRVPKVKGSANESFLLRPGLFTNIEIETGRRRDVPVIPFSAVQSDGTEQFVFVQTSAPAEQASKSGARATGKSDGSDRTNSKPAIAFERRPVQVGVRDGGLVEIVNGLQPGERVAVENAYLLESELEKSRFQD
jgi:cobalt-zinc-cadmium efflux system membrane fusion protein